MDEAVVALGREVEPRVGSDLRDAIQEVKERARRQDDFWPRAEDRMVLASEADRALAPETRLGTLYSLGTSIGWYHFAVFALPFGAPLPDFGVVLDRARRVFEEVGPAVPVLGALVQRAPGLAATGPRQLLRSVPGVGKPVDFPDEMEIASVCSLLGNLHVELYRQLAALTRPALPPYSPTGFQKRLLRAVHEEAHTADQLEGALGVSRKQLYRDGIKPLRAVGRLKNDRRQGGYYDPTAPPEKK
jgi:hypothetical protein